MAKRKPAPKKDGPNKMRPDVAETAFRVMQEATGGRPKTKPPGDRGEAEKHTEAVQRGRRGGRPRRTAK